MTISRPCWLTARVGCPGHRQNLVAVTHDDFHLVAVDAQFDQYRPGSVLAGVGDQLVDHRPSGPMSGGNGHVMVVSSLVGEGGSAVAGLCDTAVVALTA
ncbi:hypothetical protein [Streptomyces collinus]